MCSPNTVPIPRSEKVAFLLFYQLSSSMADVNVKTLAVAWANSLRTGKEPSISDLAKIVFGLSASEVRLNKLGDDKDEKQLNIDRKGKCVLMPQLSLSFRTASSRWKNYRRLP